MKEDFISFIWKHHYFSKNNLSTVTNEPLQVLKTGEINNNAGPDFFNAQIILGEQKWAGNVELHLRSSDWYAHGHEADSRYDNIILHVVWEYDVPVYGSNNRPISTLELSRYIDGALLVNYQNLFSQPRKWINCEGSIDRLDPFFMNSWLERIYFERLEMQSKKISKLLEQSKNDWEAVFFQLLVKNFGLKVNGAAFFELAKTITVSILRKEADKIERLEALFLGQAGLLNQKEIAHPYYEILGRIYLHQSKKYGLQSLSTGRIKFFRLRPNNFPTIRLAQLAALYFKYQNLFAHVIEVKHVQNYYRLFDVAASSVWNEFYTFDSRSKNFPKRLTKTFIDLILINTVIPLKFMHQRSQGNYDHNEIIEMVMQLKPEKNSLIKKFDELGVRSNSALSTQALIHLKNEYCNKQRCVQCGVGNKILRK